MNREIVIQKIIDSIKAKRYLEIGVFQGTTFQKIRCSRKVAVDPQFKISLRSKCRYILRNIGSKYREMTSNEYFARYKNKIPFDVAFIDGLHSYGQSLIDVMKTLDALGPDGVIVMHDCNPPTASAAQPADSWEHANSMNLPGWTGAWNGDVWKTIVKLRSTRKDLQIFVLDCDYGLGIITRGTPETMLDISDEKIDRLSYEDLVSNRQKWLNLKPVEYLEKFIKSML